MLKIITFMTGLIISVIPVSISQASSVNGDATVHIISPINIIPDSAGLRFGTIIPNSTIAGTVSISADDGSETCFNVVCNSSERGAAKYNISGEAGKTINILVSAVSTLSGNEASNFGSSMTSTLHTNIASTIFDPNGDATFNVGGILTIAASQPLGAYSGSFVVTVNYQ